MKSKPNNMAGRHRNLAKVVGRHYSIIRNLAITKVKNTDTHNAFIDMRIHLLTSRFVLNKQGLTMKMQYNMSLSILNKRLCHTLPQL